MEYQVEFRPEADRDLARLDRAVAQRILNRVRWLAQHFQKITIERLTGRSWKGLFKFRVGDYRVLYSVDSSKKSEKKRDRFAFSCPHSALAKVVDAIP